MGTSDVLILFTNKKRGMVMKAFRKRVGAALLFGSMVFTTANNVGVWSANDGKSEVFDIEEMGADQGGDNKENKSDSCEVSLNSDSQVSDILKKPLVTGGMGALGGTVLGIGTTLAGEKVLNSEISTKNRGGKRPMVLILTSNS